MTTSSREGPLEVRVDEDGDSLTVRVVGELDLATAPIVEDSLRSARERNPSSIVLDLDSVGFIDSTGLRMLLVAARRSREDGDRLRIRCRAGPVRRMIELTGMQHALPLIS
jgi:anti-sigma B factor antagonist